MQVRNRYYLKINFQLRMCYLENVLGTAVFHVIEIFNNYKTEIIVECGMLPDRMSPPPLTAPRLRTDNH